MPPVPTIPNVWRVTLNWSSGDWAPNGVNVFHMFNDDGLPGTIQGDLEGQVTPDMWAAVQEDFFVTSYDVQVLDGAHSAVTFVPGTPANWQGGSTGEPVPQVAALIKLQTGLTGRSRNGRLFLPMLGEAAIAGGAIDSTPLSAMQSGWDAFRSGLDGLGHQLMVASYKLAEANNVLTTTAERITGTQRRRNSRLRV